MREGHVCLGVVTPKESWDALLHVDAQRLEHERCLSKGVQPVAASQISVTLHQSQHRHWQHRVLTFPPDLPGQNLIPSHSNKLEPIYSKHTSARICGLTFWRFLHAVFLQRIKTRITLRNCHFLYHKNTYIQPCLIMQCYRSVKQIIQKYNLKLLLFMLWQRPQVSSESKRNRCCTYFVSIKYWNRETSPRLEGAKFGNCMKNTNKMYHRFIQVRFTGTWLAGPLGSSLCY